MAVVKDFSGSNLSAGLTAGFLAQAMKQHIRAIRITGMYLPLSIEPYYSMGNSKIIGAEKMMGACEDSRILGATCILGNPKPLTPRIHTLLL